MSTPPDPEDTSADHSSSSSLVVDIHILACGHGDTILVHLPGDHWVLVDCWLPERDGTREKFFKFVEDHEIRRLDFIVQTHPDVDHFHGMTEVLSFFTTQNRSIGYWCDGGVNTQQIQSLVFPDKITKKRYAALGETVHHLLEKKAFDYYELKDGHEPVYPKGYEGRVELYPIAPNAQRKRNLIRTDTARLAENPNAEFAANALSVVLVLHLKDADTYCNVLLAGDADKEGIKLALKAWQSKTERLECCSEFDAIKVPHHGSGERDSYSPDLCQRRRVDVDEAIAVVSAGEREGLPHSQVLQDYLDHGWTVLITTTRHGATVYDRPVDLANRGEERAVRFARQDITLTWTPEQGLTWDPPSAAVGPDDLVFYDK